MSSFQTETELPGNKALKILLADDNIDAADSLATLLKMDGHQVTVVNGYSAIAACDTFEPDVAILDISMPGIDGYRLAGYLRERFGERVRLIALTAFNLPAYRRRAQEAGFNDYKVKPVDFDDLVAVIQKR